LEIEFFEKKDGEKANDAYFKAEKLARQEKANKDIVLVEADTMKELKTAYPNYFLDINEFLSILDNYFNK
jgi:transketolase C-terminal domain/subunit